MKKLVKKYAKLYKNALKENNFSDINARVEAYEKKLQEMYNSQKESNDDARKDLHKSRVFNAWMMVIAIVAMLAAIAGPIVTVLVSR